MKLLIEAASKEKPPGKEVLGPPLANIQLYITKKLLICKQCQHQLSNTKLM